MKVVFSVIAIAVLVLSILITITISDIKSSAAEEQQAENSAASNSKKSQSFDSLGLKWYPDGHIPYITFPDGKRRFFLSGNQKTYTIDSPTPLPLEQVIKNNPQIQENFGPDLNIPYRNMYSTIGSVIQVNPAEPYHVFAFTNNERQAKKPDGTYDYSTFTTTIGLLESFDGGLTWKDYGPVIKGDDYLEPGTRVSGAGAPCAIIKDGYVYVYYVGWPSRTKVQHPDQIYMARSKISPNGGLGYFEFYSSGGFTNTESNLVSVIPVPNIPNASYTSFPSISYNKYLGKYLAVYETNVGIYMSVSDDAINFRDVQLILPFPKPQSERVLGDVWHSYPTFLSDAIENNDLTTQEVGNLYYSTGVWPNDAHKLTFKAFKLK